MLRWEQQRQLNQYVCPERLIKKSFACIEINLHLHKKSWSLTCTVMINSPDLSVDIAYFWGSEKNHSINLNYAFWGEQQGTKYSKTWHRLTSIISHVLLYHFQHYSKPTCWYKKVSSVYVCVGRRRQKIPCVMNELMKQKKK